MTFKKFSEIAAAHRPDAVVHAHGTCGKANRVAIYFIRKDGTESKLYHYSGSYAAILNQLGIKVVTESDFATAQDQLRMAIESNGKPSLFGKGIRDNTEKIARLEAQIERYMSDEYVRDWE